MGNPNNQIRDCTSVAYDYLQNRSDKNMVSLQKQLQSLSAVADLEIFEPTSSETLELYVCLEKFLTPSEARSTVAGKVLALLIHISESSAIRAALRDDIRIVPVLSNFMVNSKLSRDNLLKTLNLLSVISYRINIVHLEVWIMKVVHFLATTVKEGTIGDESLLLALQTLANLCRSSPLVVDCLRRLPNNKILLRTLSLMKNATMYVRLLVAEMFLFVDPEMSNAELFDNEMLDMIFTVAIEGFEENKISWLQLAADVFEELTLLPSLEGVLREYKNYATHLQLLLGRMTCDCSEIFSEALFDFVYHLVKLNYQDIRSLHEMIFSKVTEWIHSQKCGQTVFKVVKELLAASGMNTLSSASMDNFVKAIQISLISKEDSDVTHREVQHITVILGLVEHVSATNEALQLKFALKLEPSIFSDLLKKVLTLDSYHMAGGQDHMMLGEKSTADTTLISGCDSRTGRHGTASNQNPEASAVSKCDLRASQRLTLSKAIVIILAVVRGLGSIKSEHLTAYRKMMGTPPVMAHLMWAGQSGLMEYVVRAWTIISDGNLSKECLDALVAATEESPSKVKETLCSAAAKPFSSSMYMATLPADFEEKVDTMMARLGGTVRKMELQDCALTDVINMYEYKLASMAHSEQSLQDALDEANVQNRQTYHLHLQTRVQNDHLRSLLGKWESRFQKAQAEKLELLATVKEVEESSRQFKEKFIDEKEKLERRTKEMKSELLALKVAFKTTEEKSSKVQQQLSNKLEEIKNLHNQIHEEQEKGSKLCLQVQKQEEELKQDAKNLEQMMSKVEHLESINLQLKKENSDLELLVKDKDESITAKEEELEEAIIKLNKMAEIQNMIHDISSRRVMK